MLGCVYNQYLCFFYLFLLSQRLFVLVRFKSCRLCLIKSTSSCLNLSAFCLKGVLFFIHKSLSENNLRLFNEVMLCIRLRVFNLYFLTIFPDELYEQSFSGWIVIYRYLNFLVQTFIVYQMLSYVRYASWDLFLISSE